MKANGLGPSGGVGKRLAAVLAVSITCYAGNPTLQEGMASVRCAESTSRAAELVGPHQRRLAGYLQSRQSAIRLEEYNLISSELKKDPGLTLTVYLNAFGDVRLDNSEDRNRYRGCWVNLDPPLRVGPEFIRAAQSLKPSAEPVGGNTCRIVVPIVAGGRLQGLLGFSETPPSKRGEVAQF